MGLSGANFSTLPTSLVKLMSRFSVAYGGALSFLRTARRLNCGYKYKTHIFHLIVIV